MNPKSYFTEPKNSQQRQYEALKAFYCDGQPTLKIIEQFGFSPLYFKKLKTKFIQDITQGHNPFFEQKKTGPKQRRTESSVIELIVNLRKQNYSITDIKAVLHAKEHTLSLDTIDAILKQEGFAPLPKRTHEQRVSIQLPQKIIPPKSDSWKLTNEVFTTERGAGVLLFLPLLESLGIIKAIEQAEFPQTSQLSALQMVLSFLALKLIGNARWSHDSIWNMDRALGLFAGLNVLPKASTLSSYSYRVQRKSNLVFLKQLIACFESDETKDEFNLDFKAIPHWGDESVLEKNWCGSRSRAMKSILSVIVQNPESGMMNYTDAEIKHGNQNDAVLEFVDFWKEGKGQAPKMLIFDSRFTTYQNLDKLNKDNIKFLTLRRRGKKLIEKVHALPEAEWVSIQVERAKGKKQTMRVYEHNTKLSEYEGEVREIILTDHGRIKPTFLITNDFDSDLKMLIRKYARRWLVEQEIAEQISFFHLNSPSSSVVVKVDFDLTLSLLAHNLYRYLTKNLQGFQCCNSGTIHRDFLDNAAEIKIQDGHALIKIKKKSHLPILLDLPWAKKTTVLPWMNDLNISFTGATTT